MISFYKSDLINRMTNTTTLASPEDCTDTPADRGLDWNLGPPPDGRGCQRATYTADEVASLLGVSTWAIYKVVKDGECPVEPVRIGRRLVWPRSRVDALLSADDLPEAGGIR